MTLPKIATPTYELEIPSSKEKITYRPFLVKEEKLLLLAMETEKEEDIISAVKTIIDNCTFEKVNIEDLPLFDIEYIFLNVRAKSVGEVINLKLLCEDDGETYTDVEINIDDIHVDFQDNHSTDIKLNDDITVIMSYPQYDMMIGTGDTNNTKFVFNIIRKSVAQIVDGETIYERADFTDKELDEFIESLNTKQFADIQNFFETMPRLRHEVKFKNPKTKKVNKITLEGMQSFFA
tara:strand:+ start:436 stop:1140 length:705 start_codon:yes stop_codon:yes gene_type:complete